MGVKRRQEINPLGKMGEYQSSKNQRGLSIQRPVKLQPGSSGKARMEINPAT